MVYPKAPPNASLYLLLGRYSFPKYGDVSENGSEILTSYPIPPQLPWEPQVAFWNQPGAQAASGDLLCAEDLYGEPLALHGTDAMALCTTASIIDLIPNPIRRNITTSSILKSLVAFEIANTLDRKEE